MVNVSSCAVSAALSNKLTIRDESKPSLWTHFFAVICSSPLPQIPNVTSEGSLLASSCSIEDYGYAALCICEQRVFTVSGRQRHERWLASSTSVLNGMDEDRNRDMISIDLSSSELDNMTRINTNVSSLVAQNRLNRTNMDLQTSLTRLSTGLQDQHWQRRSGGLDCQ